MFGSPDDMSTVTVDGEHEPQRNSLAENSDSDYAYDVKHVRWRPDPIILPHRTTYQVTPPLPCSNAGQELIPKPKKIQAVKAKLLVAARFISISKKGARNTVADEHEEGRVTPFPPTATEASSQAPRKITLTPPIARSQPAISSTDALTEVRQRLNDPQNAAIPIPPPVLNLPNSRTSHVDTPTKPLEQMPSQNCTLQTTSPLVPHPASTLPTEVGKGYPSLTFGRPLPPTPAACPPPSNGHVQATQRPLHLNQSQPSPGRTDQRVAENGKEQDASMPIPRNVPPTKLPPVIRRVPCLPERTHRSAAHEGTLEPKRRTDLDAEKLSAELDSLVSFRKSVRDKKARSKVSSQSTRVADANASAEALCHMPVFEDDDVSVDTIPEESCRQREIQRRKCKSAKAPIDIHPWKNQLLERERARNLPVHHHHRRDSQVSRQPSIRDYEEEDQASDDTEDEEVEAIQRIKNWRVQVEPPPSLLSSLSASAHSKFQESYTGLSSHLTSVSRSPLTEAGSARLAKQSASPKHHDPEKTPVLGPRITRGIRSTTAEDKSQKTLEQANPVGVNCDEPKREPGRSRLDESFKERVITKKQDSNNLHRTQHAYKLTDEQFEKFLSDHRATSSSLQPDEPVKDDSKPQNSRPATPKLSPTTEQSRRRSSMDNITTLSVLESKVSQEMNKLDGMIQRHPEMMQEILKTRPGLLLVIALRSRLECRVKDLSTTPDRDLKSPGSHSRDSSATKVMGDVITDESISLLTNCLLEKSIESSPKSTLDCSEENTSSKAASKAVTDAAPTPVFGEAESIEVKQTKASEEESPGVSEIALTGHEKSREDDSQQAPTADSSMSSMEQIQAEGAEEGERQHATPSLASHIFAHLQDREGSLVLLARNVDPTGGKIEQAVQRIIQQVEKAGELSLLQQSLITLQEKITSTTNDQLRLDARLNTLEHHVSAAIKSTNPPV